MYKSVISAVCILSLWGCSSANKVSQNIYTPPSQQTQQQPMKKISPTVAQNMQKNQSAMSANVQDTGEPTQFKGMIAAHNYWRNQVHVPPLTWSPQLAQVAQQWANQLQSYGCGMQHSNQNYGENLASSTNAPLSPQEVVGMWAEERVSYDRNSNSCRAGDVCGHYTQLVWRETRELGCGMAACGSTQVWVCNYSPAGNYTGQAPF